MDPHGREQLGITVDAQHLSARCRVFEDRSRVAAAVNGGIDAARTRGELQILHEDRRQDRHMERRFHPARLTRTDPRGKGCAPRVETE